MIDEIKVMLGDAASSYTDAQISLAYKMALTEVEAYCRRDADAVLQLIAEKIAIIKLSRINTEGLLSMSLSGVNENYINGYPAEIVAVLNSKRKIKVV